MHVFAESTAYTASAGEVHTIGTSPHTRHRVLGGTFSLKKKYIKFLPDSSHCKKYNGSCFMSLSLSEILLLCVKLQIS